MNLENVGAVLTYKCDQLIAIMDFITRAIIVS